MKKFLLLTLVALALSACDKNKVELVEPIQLNTESTNQLSAVFSENNALLNDYPYSKVFVIHSQAELQDICPEGITAPAIDFSSNCVIFAPVQLSSVNDEIIKSYLLRDKNQLEFVIEIQRCSECYLAVTGAYAYGVFPISLAEVQYIKPTVKIINK